MGWVLEFLSYENENPTCGVAAGGVLGVVGMGKVGTAAGGVVALGGVGTGAAAVVAAAVDA